MPASLRLARVSVTVPLLVVASTALAQNPAAPKFEYGQAPDKPTDWTAQAKGGLLVTSGNSQSRNGTFSLNASRQAGSDKVSVDGGLAYGRSNILVPVLTGGEITGFERVAETTTNEWRARGRYDRFLTPNNALYLLGQVGANRVAGKKLVGGAQAGYSRQLLKNEQHTAVLEAGYDFSYESYLEAPGRPLEPVAVHSARVFAGERWKVTGDTGLNISLEALFNLNREDALDARDGTGATRQVPAFRDTRLTGSVNLTTTLYENLSFGFGFTARYDQNPAPLPIPASAKGASYAAGFQPFARRLDTLTEATLVFTFL
jgi:hypothetical protein